MLQVSFYIIYYQLMQFGASRLPFGALPLVPHFSGCPVSKVRIAALCHCPSKTQAPKDEGGKALEEISTKNIEKHRADTAALESNAGPF